MKTASEVLSKHPNHLKTSLAAHEWEVLDWELKSCSHFRSADLGKSLNLSRQYDSSVCHQAGGRQK